MKSRSKSKAKSKSTPKWLIALIVFIIIAIIVLSIVAIYLYNKDDSEKDSSGNTGTSAPSNPPNNDTDPTPSPTPTPQKHFCTFYVDPVGCSPGNIFEPNPNPPVIPVQLKTYLDDNNITTRSVVQPGETFRFMEFSPNTYDPIPTDQQIEDIINIIWNANKDILKDQIIHKYRIKYEDENGEESGFGTVKISIANSLISQDGPKAIQYSPSFANGDQTRMYADCETLASNASLLNQTYCDSAEIIQDIINGGNYPDWETQ